MWSALGIVVILIILEKRASFKNGLSQLLDTKLFFWIILNLIILTLIISVTLSALTNYLNILGVPAITSLLELSLVVQFIIFFLLFDFVKFAVHILMHRFSFLWKLHSVHHSSDKIETVAAFKLSWVEAGINVVFSCLLQTLFKVDIMVLSTINTIFLYVCIWQHTNFYYLNAPVMSSIFITPKNHRIHHEICAGSDHNNYGLIFTLWDRLFKTFRAVENSDPVYGINEPHYPHNSLLKQFLYPFIK